MSEDKPIARIKPEQATAVFDDSGWFKQAGAIGLYALIPVLGPIVIMGWGQERYTQSLTESNSLGPVSFDRDLDAGRATAPGILGWPAALMALNGLRRMAVTFAFFAMRILEGDLAPETAAVLYEFISGANELTSSLVTLLWLPWVLLLPELMRRVYQGELFPWKNPGPSLVAITKNQTAYLKVVVATTLTLGALWMLSGIFGWLWLILAPLAWAVVANFAAQWQGMVEDRGAEGSV